VEDVPVVGWHGSCPYLLAGNIQWEGNQMMVIDFTAEMLPIGLGAVALLALTVAGIGSCTDEREREAMRVLALRVGAWWLNQSSECPTAPARLRAGGAR
jgi:hypothetical protein